ncbi:uncharacterized protein V1510DRAFT_413574 [Dipodascopsis tothii]|uniref:uncharacterized protein n=1 Tax=Dipodascopsis tothii TaxID=44089 RepID=UPI0034CDCCD0
MPSSDADERPPLPQEVITCLKSARFLHLATSHRDYPHVSLMNYAYIGKGEAGPYEDDACVVMSSDRQTQKFNNIKNNPKVSLLVHDWVPKQTETPTVGSAGLAQLLRSMNEAELSRISVTLNGYASVPAGEEAAFFKQRLLESSTEDARKYIDADNTAIVVVKIISARITDVENNIVNWEEPHADVEPEFSTTGDYTAGY